MKDSRSRILTTHVGSLPRPDALLELNLRRLEGDADDAEVAGALRDAVAEVVRRQVECGIDVVNDGEFGKSTTGQSDYGPWLAYAWERLGGWEVQPDDAPSLMLRDAADFPTFYPTMWHEVGGARGSAAELIQTTVQTGPVTYTGHALVRRDLENLAAALDGAGAEEAFVTAVAPASFNRGQNRHYPSEKDFLFALADALHEEYAAIVEAGFVLQLDDPSLADEWALSPPSVSVADYREAQRVKIEAVNRAIDGLPRDRVRYHVCWGSWHGPHTTDIPLREILEVVLEAGAGAFSVEAGNVRHELDYRVWEGVEVPENLILIPGVVSHATNLVEPPELIAERIERYAEIVGPERVLAGTDCGLGGRLHPEIVWAKLRALADGARLASERLF
jgi:5-methyltetrahydropteroyltriglutamate--homocysteine methyltransferase